MATKTQLQVMNNILLRMRETAAVASTDNDYTALIASFVAEAYEEVIDAWTWRSLSDVVQYTIASGTSTIDLTNASVTSPGYGQSGTALEADSLVIRRDGIPAIEVSTDSGTSYTPLTEVTLPVFEATAVRDTTATAAAPDICVLVGKSDGTMDLNLYPTTSAEIIIRIGHYHRPTHLETDGTTDGTTLAVPHRPVQELALMYALNERGEEIGEPGNLAERRYVTALAAALEIDIKAGEHADAYDWRRN